MRIKMQSQMKVSPDLLWTNLKSTSTFRKVASPLMSFKHADEEGFPPYWKEGQSYKLKMYLFGLIPLGYHTLSFFKIDDDNRTVSTDESGQMIKTWQHTMRVIVDQETTVFRDDLFFENGLLSLPTYMGVYLFFAYRHFRLRQLIQKGMLHNK